MSGTSATDTAILNIQYSTYDGWGNLKRFENNSLQGSEIVKDYVYDALHRLDSATVTLGSGTAGTINYDYNDAGNLLTKSDYGSDFKYGNASKNAGGNAGPNALRQLTKQLNRTAILNSYQGGWFAETDF